MCSLAELLTREMKRILIIDDSNSNRDVLGLLFTGEGYTIKSMDGPEGLENILLEFLPDVVLLDIVLVRYNGAEICKWMKTHQNFSKIKVLLMTASNAFNKLNTTDTLADAHIPKPFDIYQVLELVGNFSE